jgi:hypothetical protein
MSDRVEKKQKSKQPKPSTVRKNKLLQVILASDLLEMPSCSNCEEKGLATCEVSPSNPGRCVRCVRDTLSHCDVQEFSVKNLERAGRQFHEHELALEKLEEERRIMDAKIERLRKQKKMWFEKMMRAVRRGISSVEELERVEKEEAEREAARQTEGRPSSPDSHLLDGFNWDVSFPDVPLSADVASWMLMWPETSAIAAGSSQGEPLVPMCSLSRYSPST